MSRKTNEKLYIILVILMIIAILSVDFFLLGSNLISYATNLIESATDEPNIKFSTYFKDENNEKVSNINKSIKSDNLKLYAEIQVRKEGYLEDGVIEIENNNFNLKDDILSTEISSIEGNKINLKQINVGETVEIEVDIDPVMSDKMPANMLLKAGIKLTGKYVSSENEDGKEITPVTRNVGVSYRAAETASAELDAKIITNKVFSVNDKKETIVQLLVKSRLAENQYPVEQTTMKVNIPKIDEKEPTIKILAANGRTKISSYTIENGVATIVLSNTPDKQNQINWHKNGYDEIIVTFIYEGTVNTAGQTITTNSEIKVHNSEKIYNSDPSSKTIGGELNNTIMVNQEFSQTEMYKGQLYANTSMPYNTQTTLVVTKTDLANEIVINEGLDKFVLTDDTTLDTNAKYVSTEINKKQLIDLLGTEGNITIKSGKTTLLETTKLSTVNDEKIIVNYANPVSELEIITSKPIAEGIVEIKHAKTMTANGYSRNQIRKIEELKTTGFILGASSAESFIEENAKLKETTSKAELTVLNEADLSTTEVNNVKLGVTLITDGTQYDLYNNPVIVIQMPSVVENLTFNTTPIIQNVNENDTIIKEVDFQYDNTTKQIKMKVTGEQTSNLGGELSELYIPLDLNVTLSRLAATQVGSIKMIYTNENAIQYYGGTTDVGVVEKEIGIQAPNGLIKYFNTNLSTNTLINEDISLDISNQNFGKEIEFEIALVNNTESDISNINILGKLPTTLKSLIAPNATIYFTENTKATIDTELEENGWTTNLGNLKSAKLYLIKIDTLTKGSNYTAVVKVQLPSKIVKNAETYTQYEATYSVNGQVKTESSRKILLKGLSELEVELIAQIGQENLKTGDIVKEGEVVRYTATVKNNTAQKLENIQLKANVPEGTVVVEPVEIYVYEDEPFYYEEKTDEKEISMDISSLEAGEIYTTQYEVRVNTNIKDTVTEIANKATVMYNQEQFESKEIKNTLEDSGVRVTIKRADDKTTTLVPGGNARHRILIENLLGKTIKDVKVQIVSKDYSVVKLENNITEQEIYNTNEIVIDEIPENGNVIFGMEGKISKDAENLEIYVNANYSNENYRSNMITEKLPNIQTEISLTSSHDNKIVKQGEKIEYNIIVKNVGDRIAGGIIIKDSIPEQLEVTEIYINGTIYLQTTNKDDKETYVESIINQVTYNNVEEIKTNETIQIKIVTVVKEVPVSLDGKIINNKAEVSAFWINQGVSNEVTHTLDCGQKNIITGFVWKDQDVDGRKDKNETTLSGITVSLYNTVTKNYLKDNNGDIVKIQTGVNGEYQFLKIPNGSYIIVFEHGMENYEPTTYQAEGTDVSENSKAKLYDITVNKKKIVVSGIEILNINDSIIINANLGLKLKGATTPDDDNPSNPENPEVSEKNKEISGVAWLDFNRNGQKDENETTLEGIKVNLYNTVTQNYSNTTTTDIEGEYKFTNINQGTYIIIFEYDTEKYEPTTYLAEGVSATRNSKVVLKKININGKEIITAVTDTINVKENVYNINIGLREKITFDLELNKYISKIVVQNSNETKAYDYDNETFAKVEIHRKQIQNSLVIIEYKIKVKNVGELAGYARNIVDYLPSGMTFSSELNTEWYLSENNLYTKSLENIEIKPGEEKEIKLILTKTMTNDNVGLINNRAEIYQDYNEYGIVDIDSKLYNQAQGEDDIGAAEVIILTATGGSTITYIILLIINIILIGFAIYIITKEKGGRTYEK